MGIYQEGLVNWDKEQVKSVASWRVGGRYTSDTR